MTDEAGTHDSGAASKMVDDKRPAEADDAGAPQGAVQPPGEVNGPAGPEPTRFGDWEKGGRCSDF